MPGQILVKVTLTFPVESKREPFVKQLYINELGLMDIENYPGPPRPLPRTYGFVIAEIKKDLRRGGMPYPGYIDYRQLAFERVPPKAPSSNG